VLEKGNQWYARMSSSASDEEKRAAKITETHAAHADRHNFRQPGREVISISHNRAAYHGLTRAAAGREIHAVHKI